MNFGRGFPISQENGIAQNRDSWTPVTPGKPIPQRSNMIPAEIQGNQLERENWLELIGMYSNLLQKAPDFDEAVQDFNPTAPSPQNGENQNQVMGLAEKNPSFNQTASSHSHSFHANPTNFDGAGEDCNLGRSVGQNGGNQNQVMGVTRKNPSFNQTSSSPTHSFHANPTNFDGASQDFNLTTPVGQNGTNQNQVVGVTKKNPSFNQTSSSHTHSFHVNPTNFDGEVQEFNLTAPVGQNGGNLNQVLGMTEKSPSFNRATISHTHSFLNDPANFDGLVQDFNPTVLVGQNGSNENWVVGVTEKNPSFNQTMSSHTHSFHNDLVNFDGSVQYFNLTAPVGWSGGNQNQVVALTEKNPSFNRSMSSLTHSFHNEPANFDGAGQDFNLATPVGRNGGDQNRVVGVTENPSFNRTTHSFHNDPANFNGVGQDFNPSAVMGQNENGVAGGAKKNPSFNQTAISLAQTFKNNPANWSSELMASLLRMKKNAASFASPVNGAQNKGISVLNRTGSFASPMNGAQNKSIPFLNRTGSFASPNSSTQVRSNWAGSKSALPVLGNQSQTFTPSQQSSVYNSKQLHTDGFPVPYRPYYNLNSPRSEADAASSITDPFQIVPITPDQGKRIEKQHQSEVNYSATREKDMHENLMVSIRREDAENNHCNEMLHNIGESSSSAVSTTQKEHNISDEGDEQGIDLNKTPQQKTPKRRKHRPKVVIEGKPKRTPKPKAPENSTPNNTPSGKRKYVRKKGLETSETPPENDVEKGPQSVGKRKYVRKKGLNNNLESHQPSWVPGVTVPAAETAAKSCRRQLNFDLECGESQDRTSSHQIEKDQGSNNGFNLNLKPRDIEEQTRINSMFATSAMQIAQQNGHIAGTSKPESSRNHMETGNALLLEQNAPTPPLAKAKDHALNVIARNVNMRNSIPGQNSWRNGYHQVNQRVVFQADTGYSNLGRAREPMLQTNSQSFTKDVLGFDERRGLKRRPIEQINPHTANSMDDAPFMYRKLLMPVEPRTDSLNFGSICLENHKKMKTQNGFHATISTEPPCLIAVEDNTRQETKRMNGAYGNNSILQSLNSCIDSDEVNNAVGMTADNCRFQPMVSLHNFQKHPVTSGIQSQTERIEVKRSNSFFEIHNTNPLTAIVSWKPLPTTPPKEASRCDYLQDNVTCHANVSEQKQTAKPSSSNQRLPGQDKMLQQHHKDALEGHGKSTTKAKGRPKKQKFQVSVDDITNRLEGLKVCGENEQEQHALVTYKGDGSIIPYEPIKKRKPRPKVDLDPETDRLWRLLMGKEGSEGAEALDKDKEKWWKEEREVFRGRADSFIARMHLVQGDRRFSRWKGSVVDSVIGVFLTQNVSDHLSSSAFMSLAAKFLLKSTTTNEECCQNGACVLVEEPIQILEPNGSKIGRQLSFNQRSFVSCESSHQMRHSISGTRDDANGHSRISEEEIISSQDSFDSLMLQTADEIRSSSGSNSEAEDQATGLEPSKNPGPNPVPLICAEKASMFNGISSHENWSTRLDERPPNVHHQSKNPECNMQNPRMSEVHNMKSSFRSTSSINSNIHLIQESLTSSSNFQMRLTSGLQNLGAQCFGMSREESISSLPSSASGVTEVCHTSNRAYQQNELPRFQAPTQGQYDFLSNHTTHLANFQQGPHVGNSLHLINNQQQERSKTFQLDRAFEPETIRQTGAPKQDSADHKFRGTNMNTEDRISVVDKQNCVENTAAEVHSKKQNYTSREPISGAGTSISKSRKGTADDEKKRTFDWDSLRKQAQLNGERRERSKDAMDSMDYESLRCANVKEISDAIRERGMNNMLADRIKDFLNRLVRDHGSIDLEWLRDIPPDKAKEYLLSIRGLGLKSVECVRLLTLHHLAFPVDTNVGRIAVRLGWVPLQPLPESLQLHLLELYPVLESIQKYIWPRLCKLDQLTLYELHYQMITFGKVFCTKSKPNCNACPMRAECRHFASAFASARLALPGPEEKSIVRTDPPIAADRNPTMVIKPMALPPAENNTNKDRGSFDWKCEPIIEEPATPEPEISETDIEDGWFEEDDEIPTIKLNMEEFTMNLQNIMQDNMELQGDMSKALVALNPEAASIPTPKLKNVSRLRTEHQVYELPDSHPLLEGLDKREPDDPSPYLLAIWIPGETANSVQPPERMCPAQESGKLCEKKTCFSCNSIREANSQIVRGTLLIPCRTAMRGSFPLNGTYFQVNEMFADHESSVNPIDVPRSWIWNLPRRTVYFGTSVSTIFKGLTTEGIQYCFWRGFVCVRGFDQKTRAPRPLRARLHFPASKLVKTKNEGK